MDCVTSRVAAKLGTTLDILSLPGAGARLIIDLPKEPRDDETEAKPYSIADCG